MGNTSEYWRLLENNYPMVSKRVSCVNFTEGMCECAHNLSTGAQERKGTNANHFLLLADSCGGCRMYVDVR